MSELQPLKILNYPLKEEDRYGAYIHFFPQQIDGPVLKGGNSLADVFKKVTKSMISVADRSSYGTDTKKEIKTVDGTDNDKTKLEKTQARTLYNQGMKIYLPTAFTTTDTLTYDSPSIGVTGASIEAGLNNAEGSVTDVIGTGISNFIDTFKTGGNAALGKLGVARLSNKFGTTNIGNGVASALRVTVDPNIRTLFRGVGIRNFQFQFKFLASSPEEADEIENIIKRFRYYAYPESISLSDEIDISVGFKFPNPFQIFVKHRGKPEKIVEKNEETGEEYITGIKFPEGVQIGPKMKTCYLTNVTTNFNPTTMAFHDDGKPVEIDLSLSFTEQTTLNRDDIKEGF